MKKSKSKTKSKTKSKSSSKLKMLKPSVYFVLDPSHLLNDEINSKTENVPKNGKLFSFKGYTFFVFRSAYGSSTTQLTIGGNFIGKIDCDYGILLVVSADFVKELNNRYTNWFLANFYGKYFSGFQIDEPLKPTIKNGVFQLDDIMVDTTNLPEKEMKLVKKFNLKINGEKQLNRNLHLRMMLLYLWKDDQSERTLE